MEEVLSDESYVVLCDALTEGCPMGQVSRGYVRRFGYSPEECHGQRCCGHPLGVAGEGDSAALANIAQAAGFSTPAAAAAALDVVVSKVVAKLTTMAAKTPPSVGFALALNSTKEGELVPCELDLRLQRHPVVDWKYCVVVVRDVSHDLSTRMLLSVAAKGEAALEDLTQARFESQSGARKAFPADASSSQYLNGLAAEMFRSRLSGTAEMLKSTRKGKKSATPSIASRSTSSGGSSISYVSSASSSSSASRAPPASLADLASGQPQQQSQQQAPPQPSPQTPDTPAAASSASLSAHAKSRAAASPYPASGRSRSSQGSATAPATAEPAAPIRGFTLHQLALASGAPAQPPPVRSAAPSRSSSGNSASGSSRASQARHPPVLPIRSTPPTLPAVRPPPTPVAEASTEEDSDFSNHSDAPFCDLLEDHTRPTTSGNGGFPGAAASRHSSGSSSGLTPTTRRVRPRPWPDVPVLARRRQPSPDNFVESAPSEESPVGTFGGMGGEWNDPFHDLLEEWDPMTEVDAHPPPPVPGAPHSWALITAEVVQARRDARFQKVARHLARRELLDLDFPMVIVDPTIQGCPFVICSAGFNDLVGCRRGEAVGRSWQHLRAGVPGDRICPRANMEMLQLCEVAAQNRYFCRQDGRGSALLRAFEDVLPEGELTCAQTVMTGFGRLARCALHLKQVELDEEMFVLGVMVELPDGTNDVGRHPDSRSIAGAPANGLVRSPVGMAVSRTLAQLREGMHTALQVLSSQFWLSSPMRRQVARDDIAD